MSLLMSQYGQPIILFDPSMTKDRIKDREAYKTNILAACSVSNFLRSSMGPKGMDKMLVSKDGDVTVTNDGATIVENMSIEHPIAKLLVELSKSQDDESGDGTTGVVVLAGALLEQAQKLLDKGIHPLKIIEGFDKACEYALEHLDNISTEINLTENNNEFLKKAGKNCSLFQSSIKISKPIRRNRSKCNFIRG